MATAEDLSSRIRHVTVYREGAIVLRDTELPTTVPSQVALRGLPLALDDESLRAHVEVIDKGQTPAGLPQVLDARVEIDVPPLGQPIEPPSEAEQRDAATRVARLQWQIARLEDEAANFDRVTLKLPERIEREPPRSVSATAWQDCAAWVQRAKETRAKAKQSLRRELDDAVETQQRLRRRILETQAERGVDEEAICKQVVVSLRADANPAPGRLVLEYRVPGACWRPTYEIRVHPDGKKADVQLRAMVAQHSGEPWNGVALALSTADLLRTIELPELRSLRIGRRQAEPARRAWREPPKGIEELFADLDRALQSRPEAAGMDITLRDIETIGAGALDSDDFDDQTSPVRMLDEAPARHEVRAEAAPYKAKKFSRRSQRRRDAPTGEFAVPQELLKDMAFGGAVDANEAAPAADREVLLEAELDADLDDDLDASYAAGAPMMAAQAVEESAPEPGARPSRMPPAPPAAKRRAPSAKPGLRRKVARRIEVQHTLLTYSSLRMVAWDSTAGRRGSLQPVEPLAKLQTQGFAVQQIEQVRERVVAATLSAMAAVDFPRLTTSVDTSSGAYDYRYTAGGKVDVPGDGRPHSVPLLTRQAPITLTLVVVPRESDQAVRVASLDNPLQAPILAGPADVYWGEEFLVTSRLETVPAGAKIDIGLGVEPALKVARNIHFDDKAEGLLRGSRSLTHRVHIALASRLAHDAQIEVRERVPIIDDDEKEIEVKVDAVTPAWEEFKQSPSHPIKGGKRWRLGLAAGESKNIEYGYTVHIDAKSELIGGNRREEGTP